MALHALAGGLAAEATGSDFRSGAIAAGANEALVTQLARLVEGDPQLLIAASQITGIVAAGMADGDVQKGAEIAGNATTYNYLSHWQEAKKDEELKACKQDASCEIGTQAKWAMIDAQQDIGLLVGSAGGIALSAGEVAEGIYELVTSFPEVMASLKQLATSPEFRQQFGENYLNDLQVRANRLAEAYETAGWEGSITAGVEGGRFAAELAGVLAAVKGGMQLAARLPSAAGKLVDAAKPSPNVVAARVPALGVLDDGAFAQVLAKSTKAFSEEGQKIYSQAAGRTIKTVSDLTDALKQGVIKPSQVPLDYVLIDGQKVIANTRSSTALINAGIPKDQWLGVNKTGVKAYGEVTFDDLVRNQLNKNYGGSVKNARR